MAIGKLKAPTMVNRFSGTYLLLREDISRTSPT